MSSSTRSCPSASRAPTWPRVAARDGAVAAPVLAAVRSQHGLAAAQASQLRRLRREAVAPVSTLPFVAGARLHPDDVEHLAGHLARRMDGAG